MAIGITTLKQRFARARAAPTIARGIAGSGNCRNCGAAAPGEYCPSCGQETRVALPTFREFMRDAMGRLVGFDGRLWRTLYGLVFRPGFLTKEYFAGRRRRYVRPGRLFLVMSLLLFAVVGFVESPSDLAGEVVVVKSDDVVTGGGSSGAATQTGTTASAAAGDSQAKDEKNPADAERVAKAIAKAKARKAARAQEPGADETFSIGLDDDLNVTIAGVEKALPPVLRQRFVRFKESSRQDKAERLYAGLLRYGPYAMFALLPAFAFLLMLTYVGRSRRYPTRPRFYSEHLVYSAHLHAFTFFMIMLWVLVPYGAVRAAIAIWIIYYIFRARGLVYGGRWWADLLRSSFIVITYSVLVTFAIMGLLVMAMMLR